MTILTFMIAYSAVAIFVVAVVLRFLMWSRMPMHVRWELYPVAHEGAKASYGGSYLEESEWWKRPRHFSLWGELRAMVPEILFLVALKEHNPRLWTRSFPFHFGLYLAAGSTGLMAVAGVLGVALPGVMAGGVGAVVRVLIPVLGYAGLVLGLIGALGLIQRRRQRPLRDYSAPMDTVNLVFFVLAFSVALVTALAVDRSFATVSQLVGNLATFRVVPLAGTGAAVILPSVSAILLAMLLAYIPLTHMSHFVGKYFTYHAVRWDDAVARRGGSIEKTMAAYLAYRPTWAAPHVTADGSRTWADIAASLPPDKVKR